MPIYGGAYNYGYIKMIYPTGDRVLFKFHKTNGKMSMNPKDGYYYIPRSHANYEALVQLLYKVGFTMEYTNVNGNSFKRKLKLYAKTKETLVDGFAEVENLYVYL